jgi:hypothetical protein
MGDDLSHGPYVSGSCVALAPPKVSNVRFGKSGVVGWSVTGLTQGWGVPDAATYRTLGCILEYVARPAGPSHNNRLRFPLLAVSYLYGY